MILKNGFRYNVPEAKGKISSRLCGGFFRAVRRTEERPLAVFVCAKMPEGVCFFSVFFRLGGAAERKKTATEKFFSYRGKNADTASENTWLRTTDLPKRISEMKQKISDKIFRKSYGKNIQKHNKE